MVTDQQAREILLRYRRGTSDDLDPEVRAALDLTSRDPGLAEWLRKHLSFQADVRAKFLDLPVPEGLKEQILSERAGALEATRSTRRLVLAGLAAAMAIGVVLIAVLLKPGVEERFETFRFRMVRLALRGYAMDLATRDVQAIRMYLSEHQAQGNWESPPGLDKEPVLGCARLRWRSRPAAMICYGTSTQPDLWLFVVDSDALADPPKGEEPVWLKVNRLNTAAWTRAGRTYLLAGEMDVRKLRAYLGQ